MASAISIDFDILMHPSIDIYQGRTDFLLSGNFPEIEALVRPDYEKYRELTSYLLCLFKQIPYENVFFIQDHRRAGLILSASHISNLDLINIDYHHDIAYGTIEEFPTIDEPNDGNWVRYLYDQGLINTYTWVRGPHSSMPTPEWAHILNQTLLLSEIPFYQLGVPDYLILCLSPDWVPASVQPLYKLWMELAQNEYQRSPVFIIN